MTTPKSSRKGVIINVLLTVIALGLLGWTVRSNSQKLAEVWAKKPDLRLFALSLAVYVVALLVTFLRWYKLVVALDLPFRMRDAIRLGFIGNVFNLVIPGAVGGDVVKAAFLCREQEKRTQAVASMVIDRALGLLGLFVLASIFGCFVWAESPYKIRRVIAFAWFMSACGVIGLAILFTPKLYRPLMRLFPTGGKLAKVFGELVEMARAYRRKLGTIAGCLTLAAASHTLYVFAFYLVDKALFAMEAPTLVKHFVVVPLILFSTAIPMPFGALGVSEQIAQGMFGDILNFSGGAIAMLGYRAIMYSAGLVSVLVYLVNIQQVRSLRESVSQPS